MPEEEKKKITSIPPPPTDDIDEAWAGSAEGDKAKTAAAPLSAEPPAPVNEDEEDEDEEDEDEEDEDEEDEDEEDEDEEDEDEEEARARNVKPATRAQSDDWLPDWAPMAVLIGLIAIGLIGGLGFLSKAPSGNDSGAEDPGAATPTTAQEAPAPGKQPIQVRRINPSDVAPKH